MPDLLCRPAEKLSQDFRFDFFYARYCSPSACAVLREILRRCKTFPVALTFIVAKMLIQNVFICHERGRNLTLKHTPLARSLCL